MTLEIQRTINGKPLIIIEGYKYRESYARKCGDIIWKCLGKSCSATIMTNAKKTEVTALKTQHSGPHPVTLRSLTSPKALPALPATTSVSNAAACKSPNTVATSFKQSNMSASTPTLMVSANSISALPGTPTFTDTSKEVVETPETSTESTPNLAQLLVENLQLRNTIAEMNLQYKCVLDHSVESDARLMQYTDKIFVTGAQKEAVPNPPKSVNVDRAVQCQPPQGICRNQSCVANQELVRSLRTSIEVLEAEVQSLKEELLAKSCTTDYISQSTIVTSPPAISLYNSFETLATTTENKINKDDFTTVINKRKKNKKSKVTKKPNSHPNSHKKIKVHHRNVTVVGDSHCRGLAALMTARTTGQTKISGICKPGAGLLDIAPSFTPPDNHAFVVIAGTNDVASGKQNIIFRHMEEIIKKCKEASRVLVSPLLPRYDLPPTSPIHEAVALVNNFISELCHRHEEAELLDLSNLGRRHFTRHGLHLNAAGKDFLAGLIVKELAHVPPRPCQRPSARKSVTIPLRPPPLSPITLLHDTYSDAVINGPSKEKPYRTLQTDYLISADCCVKSSFLGNPPLGDGVNRPMG